MAKPQRRKCAFCDTPLPKGARPNRKYCDDDCRRGRFKIPTAPPADGDVDDVRGPVERGIDAAIEQAQSLSRLGPLDAGAIAAIKVLARQIDETSDRWEYCLKYAEWARDNGATPPKPPPMDTVSIPTFRLYCESLGLTPAGRGRIPGAPKESGSGRKLDKHEQAAQRK